MESAFFVGVGVDRLGPFSLQQIEKMVLNCHLGLFDSVYDNSQSQWLQVSEVLSSSEVKATSGEAAVAGLMPDDFKIDKIPDYLKKKPSLIKKTKEEAVKTVPATSLQQPQDAASWFVREGGVVLGPYSFLTLMSMYRDGSLSDEQEVRRGDRTQWQQIQNAISKEDKEFFKTLVPERMLKKNLSHDERREYPREDLPYLFHVNNGKSDVVVQGYDISINGFSMISLAPVLKVHERVTCKVAVKRGQMVQISGLIVRVDHVESAHAQIPLNKYAVIATSEVDLSLFEQD